MGIPCSLIVSTHTVADSRCTNGLVAITGVSFIALPNELIINSCCRLRGVRFSLDGSKANKRCSPKRVNY